jgi:enoyl-[acyl-carrier protein] reductase II
MAWVGTSRLAIAVSEAGGLGTLGSGAMNPESLKKSIDEIRGATDKPFAVNLMLLNPHIAEQVSVCIREKVPAVVFGAGNPAEWVPKVKEAGIKVAAVVSSETLATYLENKGVDAIIGEGMECGGHVGSVTVMTLIPVLKEQLRIPLIAAGGIADERGIEAVFCLGAEGVQLGTRLIATEECEAHPHYKQRIVDAGLRDTVLTGLSLGHPARVIKTAFAKQIIKCETKNPDEAEQLLTGSLRRAFTDGDLETGVFMAGQSVGLIHTVESVSTLFNRWIEALTDDHETERS